MHRPYIDSQWSNEQLPSVLFFVSTAPSPKRGMGLLALTYAMTSLLSHSSLADNISFCLSMCVTVSLFQCSHYSAEVQPGLLDIVL